ncbi:hypothetical protein MMH89_04340 [Candidatus Comchoanobacter bicostacola]|uniref:RNA polymerase sigma-70 region 2 domain-containing protein n=1 Tax=Candidatus Comchoanobacter bicostacola TaxID=2919598 RepID=A0ABY5DKX9_9GAMM|nr:sigma factor [Candidatus Comchoanobacter bicostacola]UTC24447.1 hypothetical protein MMH89_04340 [Candidatus Comchoanobacter bicostacola]
MEKDMEVYQYNSGQLAVAVCPESAFKLSNVNQAYGAIQPEVEQNTLAHAYAFVNYMFDRVRQSFFEFDLPFNAEVHGKLTKAQEYHLIHLAQQGDDQAAAILHENFSPLIISFAKDFIGRGVQFSVLIQAGCEGLQRAILGFDPEYDVRLVTHAYLWIRQSMTRCVKGEVDFIRVPDNKHKKFAIVCAKVQEGKSIEDIAELLNESVKTVKSLIRLIPRVESLDTAYTSEHDGYLHEQVAASTPSSEEHCLSEEKIELVKRFISDFDQQSQSLLVMRYGLEGREYNLQEIADTMTAASSKKWNKERVRVKIDALLLTLSRKAANHDKGTLNVQATRSDSLARVSLFSAPAKTPIITEDYSLESDSSMSRSKGC